MIATVQTSKPPGEPNTHDLASSQAGALAAWCVWMIAIVGTLALFAARVPLAAKMPAPIEDGALIAVGVVAMAMASLLAPLLLTTWRNAVIAIASMGPMLVLAALLSGEPASAAMRPAVVGSLWLLAITCLLHRRRVVGTAVVSALLIVGSLGGPILWYFAMEFTDRAAGGVAWIALVSPTQGMIATVLGEPGFMWRIVAPAAVIGFERAWTMFSPKLLRRPTAKS